MTIETVEQLYQSSAIALSLREFLRPASGDVVFPPTYAPASKNDKSGYNISPTRNGNLCTIDSIGSQANRMEPIFMEASYRDLVPQITVKAGEAFSVNLLKMGHRLADAAIRFSDLRDPITEAFLAYRQHGDATGIAKIGPTSLVFGVWDSRETHTKISRLLNSTIRAFHVDELTRSALYTPTFEYSDIGFAEGERENAAEIGLAHVPSTNTHGGVIVNGSIVRQTELNLNALRMLSGTGTEGAEKLQRYILGLALIAMLAPRTHDLRQGCLLAPDPDQPATLRAVLRDGHAEELALPFAVVKDFAKAAAEAFGVGEPREGVFNSDRAKAAAKKANKK
ncbi:MAG: type I-U CRISPR-associated protein Cas7 [Synechococcaceae cyanobacterium SM1_2_3]|nr:type I-U CRISPR-associated protein Cas7 [Synechococcaceae cyanobacterium SM1_2_3]